MKKRLFSIGLLLLFAALVPLVGCAPATETRGAERAAAAAALFTAEKMQSALAGFIGDGSEGNDRADRTSFRDGERAAAKWLEQELLSYGYVAEAGYESSETPLQRPFTYGGEYNSQNVTAVYPSSAENAPQILLTANYDNLHGTIGNLRGAGGAGALQNGTGVAILLALAEALMTERPELPFDVRFVFFGASEVGLIGSEYYVSEQMTARERADTVLVVGVRRIGGDYTYLYTDEVDTMHGDLFLDTAKSASYAVKAQPRDIPYIPTEYKEGLPYATWGMIGDQIRFMSRDVNIVSLYGGNLETLNLGDIDGTNGTISYTADDTLAGLQAQYPAYGERMADAANLLYDAIRREDFLSVCRASAAEKYDYTWLTKPAVVTGIVLGILVLSGVGLIFLVRHFEKKYPIKPLVRKLKIAVFGMEYEKPDEENIFVDVQPNGRPPNPFE